MKLTKNKIIMISIASVAAVVVVVVVVMLLGALSVKSENEESISFAESTFAKFAKSKVTPCDSSVKAIESNNVQLVKWYDIAMDAVSRGDMSFTADVNEAAFKQKMIDEAMTLSKLPGKNNGALVSEGFTFGFDAYIGGGELPQKSLLPVLQRQWSDIKLFVNLLASSEVDEIKSVKIDSKPVVAESVPEVPTARGRKKTEEAKPLCSQEGYTLEFVARPGALVKALNAFSTNERFTIIDSMEFFRESDTVGIALSSGEKKQDGAKQAKKHRRRSRSQESGESAGTDSVKVKKTGFITEPSMEEPMLVKCRLVTCDFGSKQQKPVESQKEQEQ